MSTIFLRFTDESEFLALLPEGIEPTNEITGRDYALSVIGTIYNVDNTDPENPVYTPKPGWHVNGIGNVPESLMAYQIAPEPGTPVRVFP